MILTRSPLRISLIGGGTDIPAFFRLYPGRVISTTIDKYVYVVVNPTPLIDKISARYSKTETVNHPSELEHARLKALLLHMGIESNLEIGSFASLPSRTGLGSSSSFSVALVKALQAHAGKKINATEAAEKASELEIDLLKEPIGKQDQYAAAHGGLNFFQFNPDGSVVVEPILLDFKKKAALNESMFLFFTGIERDAGSVLSDQSQNIESKFESYKALSDSVLDFKKVLLSGDIKALGAMLHESWMRKKELSTKISNPTLDALYEAGIKAGAWGGKVLGAGGGGCLLFVAPKESQDALHRSLSGIASALNLSGARHIPFSFSQSGTDLLLSDIL